MNLLDMPAVALERDSGRHDKLVRALAADRGVGYMDALNLWQRGMLATEGRGTVREALEAAAVRTLDAIEADVRNFEARDQAVAEAHERLVKLDGGMASAMNEHGASFIAGTAPVHDDGSVGISDEDAGRIIGGDRVFRATRLVKARRLAPSGYYDGPDGERRFHGTDEQQAHVGRDHVGELERAARGESANNHLNAIAKRLDQALARGSSPADRRRLLDAAISEGKGELRKLEQAAGAKPTLKLVPSGSEGIKTLEQEGRELVAAVDERTKQLMAQNGLDYSAAYRLAVHEAIDELGGDAA